MQQVTDRIHQRKTF